MAVVTDLVTRFSFTGNTGPLASFNDELVKATAGLVGLAAALAGAAAAALEFTRRTLESLDPLEQLSRTTGVSIEKIQELGFIASVSGSDLNAVTTSIEALTDSIGEASVRGSEDFARLGISVRTASGQIKTADQVLEELRQRFRQLNLSLAQQRTLAAAIGVSPELLQLVNRSTEEMQTLTKAAREFGVVSEEQGDLLVAANDSFTVMKFAVSSLSNQFSLNLAPTLKDTTELLTDFIRENKVLISEGIEATTDAIVGVVSEFKRLAGPIVTILAPIVGVRIALAALTKIIAFLTAPLGIAVAAISGAVLIVDDLAVAFRGGESAIGRFAEKVLGIDIVPVLRAIVEEVRVIFHNLGVLFDGLSERVTNALGGVGERIRETFSIDVFKEFGQSINRFFGIDEQGERQGTLIPRLSRQDETEPQLDFRPVLETNVDFQPVLEPQVDLQDVMLPQLERTRPVMPDTFQQNNTTNNVTQNVTIPITANDVNGARVGVREGLQEQLRTADDMLRRNTDG